MTTTPTEQAGVIVSDVPKTSTTVGIGKVFRFIFITLTIISSIILMLIKASHGGSTTEFIPINTTHWTWVETDPYVESASFGITDRSLEWFVAINGDTKNPILRSPNLPDKKLGDGVTKIGFTLRPDQGVTNAKIRFERKPK